jgi:hypothetical protein
VVGDGTPQPRKKRSGDIEKNINKFLITKVGHEIAFGDLIAKLKIKNKGYPRKIMDKLEAEGRLIRLQDKPRIWRVDESITSEAKQRQLTPSKPPPTKTPPKNIPPAEHTVIPDFNSPMQSSAALSHFMQLEQQNILYRQVIQQLLVLYEQQSAIFQAAGLLEDDQ